MSLVLYHLLRLLFGLAFGVTALGKLLDNRGFAEVLAGYQLGLPGSVLLVLALVLALGELLLAMALWAGWMPRTVAALLVVLLTGYTGVAWATLSRGLLLADCGCFGVFVQMPLGPDLLAITGGLLLLALVYLAAASRHGPPRERNVFREGP